MSKRTGSIMDDICLINPVATNILVVDDDVASLHLLSELLFEEGHLVRQAQDGEMALRSIKSQTPDLILLDINMLGMSGYEVCNFLKNDLKTACIPVIFLSGLNEIESKIQCFDLGGVDFISKPYEPAELLMRVKKHIELFKVKKQLKALIDAKTSELEVASEKLSKEIDLKLQNEIEIRLAAQILENAIEAVLILDNSGQVFSVNPAFTEITGHTENETIGLQPAFLESFNHDQIFTYPIIESLKHSDIWVGDTAIRHKDGNLLMVHSTISVLRAADNAVQRYTIMFIDEFRSKETVSLINYLRFHDGLTGLANRFSVRQNFEQFVNKAKAENRTIALLCLDLDRFKIINEANGYPVGDQVLRLVAQRLFAYADDYCVVSRNGGDEFQIIISIKKYDEGNREIYDFAAKVLASVAMDSLVGDHVFSITTSIGIAISQQNSQSFEDLILKAEAALDEAKYKGGNQFQLFTDEMDKKARQKIL